MAGDQDERPVVAERQIADCDVAGLGQGTRSMVSPSLFFHDAPRNATPARGPGLKIAASRTREAGPNASVVAESGRRSRAVNEPGYGQQ